jgi:hypothetical protein
MIKIMTLFAWLTGVASVTLDTAVYYTVVKMGNYISNLSAIGVAWRILRDIGNIVLIFGFIAIGISIILNTERIGYGKKMLPTLLIAAVFLNFSLFISEAVIDAGNIFATQFYQQINGGNPAGATTFDPGSVAGVSKEGISNKIMNQLGLQTLYGNAQTNQVVLKAGNTWVIGFMGILLFLITAFVMFSLAFILISRFVVLIFLIVVAPIGFAGLAVPKLESTAKEWWSMLFKQTITAPVLLLLLYVALAVITDAKFLTGFCSNADPTHPCVAAADGWLNNNFSGFASFIISFLIAMGLLVAVIMVSKKMGAIGASWATKWGGALSFGAAAYGTSAVLGGAARGLRYGVQRFAPNSTAGRYASRYLRRAENLRFDARSLPGVGLGLKTLGAGEAAATVGGSTVSRGGQARQWFAHSGEAEDKLHGQETRVPRLRQAIAEGDMTAVNRHLGNMSDKELESGEGLHMLLDPHTPAAVAALPQARYEKLLTSEALNDAQKTQLRNQRDLGLIQRYTTLQNAQGGVGPGQQNYQNSPTHATAPNATIPSVWNPGQLATRAEQAVRGLTDDGVKQLPDAVLRQPQVYEHLTTRQLSAIQSAGRIEDGTATTIGNFLRTNNDFIAYFYSGNPRQQAELNNFWHTNLQIRQGGQQGGGQGNNPGGGGAPAAPVAGGPAGAAGYQPNPGGIIAVQNNPGGGPRPRNP